MSADPVSSNEQPKESSHPDGGSPNDGSVADHFKAVGKGLLEFWDYLCFYLTARWDLIKIHLRDLGVYAAIAVLAGLIAATALITAVVMLMSGLAQLINGAIALAWGDPVSWPGPTIVGLLVLAAAALAIYLAFVRIRRTWYRRAVNRYEQRRTRQARKYAQHIADRPFHRQNHRDN